MTRCNTCNGIVTKTDSECFTCGERVPGAPRPARFQKPKSKAKAKTAAPVTPVTNLLFMGSLVLTGVSFLSSHKMPLPVSATLSGALFVARLVTDRKVARITGAIRHPLMLSPPKQSRQGIPVFARTEPPRAVVP